MHPSSAPPHICSRSTFTPHLYPANLNFLHKKNFSKNQNDGTLQEFHHGLMRKLHLCSRPINSNLLKTQIFYKKKNKLLRRSNKNSNVDILLLVPTISENFAEKFKMTRKGKKYTRRDCVFLIRPSYFLVENRN